MTHRRDAHAGRHGHCAHGGHRARHRDHIPGEERELHAGLALGDAIAHGGYAASHLRCRLNLTRGIADDLRIMLVRRVGGKLFPGA